MKAAKEATKEIKAAYTENDFLRMFNDAVEDCGYCDEIYGDIISADVEIWLPTVLAETPNMSVNMVIYDYNSFYKIRFYIDDWKVRQDLLSYHRFDRVV